jgi:hypothetical protein
MGGGGVTFSLAQSVAAKPDFWEKIDFLGDCWVWTGATMAGGYGKVTYSGVTMGAHRCVFTYTTGIDAANLFVCHHCDNPPCVNPAHLYVGTPKQNSADMVRRKRASRHAKGALAVLTESEVLEARAIFAAGGATVEGLAATFGVQRPTIRDLLTGRTWKTVGGPLSTPGASGKRLVAAPVDSGSASFTTTSPS